ncbi:GntR family transcriptional regulator [Microbacterium oxydans]|uniref:GntR family transcriptional regulator n=1 Tax=Microbacterium oxydans TaxID=82380 RepID=UPI002B46DCC0|nr:GntR family transcriptional regulator [Microbacterium oxydans]
MSLREVAVDRIRATIFDGTLVPGERLSDEELQRWLGMSRTPVREALSGLTRIGLVETAP